MSLQRTETRRRHMETGLAWFTLGSLVFYVPAETYISRTDLTSPGYIVDAIAMILLLVSSIHSLRARPRCAPGPLSAAWGWSACLAWRSYFTRVLSRQRGLGIYPPESRWQEDVLVWVLMIALLAFAFSFMLAWRNGAAPSSAPRAE